MYCVVFSGRHVGLCRILSSGFRHVFGCIYIYDVAQLTLCLQVAVCLSVVCFVLCLVSDFGLK